MKTACKILVSLALLQGVAWAQAPAPEIQIVDGKVTMSAQGVPLGRLLSLLDRALGLNSTVKPEVSNRLISVRFTELPVKDAVHKIFEGQPLNYMFVEGKGISRIELAQASTTTTAGGSSSFDSGPVFNQAPLQGISPVQPVNAQPLNAQPVNAQPPNPQQPNAPQPANANNSPFGPVSPAPAAAASSSSGGVAPGQVPPPIGGTNPLVSPAGAQPAPTAGFPIIATPPPQQTGPGNLGATPGVVR